MGNTMHVWLKFSFSSIFLFLVQPNSSAQYSHTPPPSPINQPIPPTLPNQTLSLY